VVIPGGVVATKKFADEKPELVAKWLEGYQRGVDYMIDNPRESAKHLGKYFRENAGINLSDEVCLKEFETPAPFSAPSSRSGCSSGRTGR